MFIDNLGNISFDDSDTALDTLYREADSLTGGAAFMVATFPSMGTWMNLLEYVLKGGSVCDVPDGITKEIVRHELERTLFNEAFSMMLEMNPEQGWQAKKVLADLYAKVGSESLSKSDGVQLGRWSNACTDILDNKKAVTPLGDDRMEVGRALLLLLLRPDPQDVIDSRDSSLKPGMEVRCLAAILSGTRCGLEGLSNDIKSVAHRYGLFAGLKAQLMNSGWKKSVLHEHIDIPEVNIQSNEWGPMGTHYKVLVDGKELLEWKDEGPLALTHVRAAAAEAGIKLKYERAMNRLSYRRELGEGRKQFVYITDGVPNAKGENTIRIWSPCLDFSKPKGRKLLTMKRQIKLLEMNSEPDLYCRFAKSESEKMILVISDQILRTMDEPELLAALEHVALTADNYEKEIGLDVF